MKVILASASPRRKELLEQIGFEPEIIPSSVEEQVTASVPEQVVQELSAQKAADVAAGIQENGILVIGADTVVSTEGQILGKPGSKEEAARMVRGLAGKEHQVYTGVTLIYRDSHGNERQHSFFEKTEVSVFPMEEW